MSAKKRKRHSFKTNVPEWQELWDKVQKSERDRDKRLRAQVDSGQTLNWQDMHATQREMDVEVDNLKDLIHSMAARLQKVLDKDTAQSKQAEASRHRAKELSAEAMKKGSEEKLAVAQAELAKSLRGRDRDLMQERIEAISEGKPDPHPGTSELPVMVNVEPHISVEARQPVSWKFGASVSRRGDVVDGRLDPILEDEETEHDS